MKCLDTTYLIDLIRNPSALKEITERIDQEERVAITVFNIFEAYLGAFAIEDKEKAEKIKDKLDKAVNRIEILEFSYKDAIRASQIAGSLLKDGKEVGADAITAAIALNNGYNEIVTRNKKYFELIGEVTGLKVEVY